MNWKEKWIETVTIPKQERFRMQTIGIAGIVLMPCYSNDSLANHIYILIVMRTTVNLPHPLSDYRFMMKWRAAIRCTAINGLAKLWKELRAVKTAERSGTVAESNWYNGHTFRRYWKPLSRVFSKMKLKQKFIIHFFTKLYWSGLWKHYRQWRPCTYAALCKQ